MHPINKIKYRIDMVIFTVDASYFQEWVHHVLQQLKSSSPSFILCIMPNKLLLKGLFEEEFVLEQLRLNRLTEAVEQSRTHHGEQISHKLFASRYMPFVKWSSSMPQQNVPLNTTCVQVWYVCCTCTQCCH